MMELIACPWCGSRWQSTDPWGTCLGCKIPWQLKNFMPQHEGMLRDLCAGRLADMRKVELALFPLSPQLSGRPVDLLVRAIERLKS